MTDEQLTRFLDLLTARADHWIHEYHAQSTAAGHAQSHLIELTAILADLDDATGYQLPTVRTLMAHCVDARRQTHLPL